MESNPDAWMPDSPWRSPAWRWLRGLWLHECDEQAGSPLDDEGVRRVLHFLRGGDSKEGHSPVEPDATDPALGRALRLFRDGLPHLRWRLEGYLLTREPMDVVAGRSSLPPATVQTYHDIFYEVRPHLDARDWVWLHAIRAGARDGYAEDHPGGIWKRFAYAAGPLALELAIAVTTGAPFPHWVRDSFRTNPAYEEARLRLVGKLLVGALGANSPAELGPLVKAREQLREMDREALGKTEGPGGLLAVMEDFLSSCSGRKSRRHRPGGKPPKTRKQAASPAREEKGGWRATIDSLLESLK